MSEIIRTYWLQILLAYFSVMGIILLWRWIRTRGKIQARIKTPLGEVTQWVKPEFEGNLTYVTFTKESKKKPGWKAEVTNKAMIQKPAWLGLKHYWAFDIFPQAEKAIEYNFDTKAEDQPRWDKATSKKYATAKVLENLGQGDKTIAPGVIWICVILLIVIIIINILPYLGRFR